MKRLQGQGFADVVVVLVSDCQLQLLWQVHIPSIAVCWLAGSIACAYASYVQQQSIMGN